MMEGKEEKEDEVKMLFVAKEKISENSKSFGTPTALRLFYANPFWDFKLLAFQPPKTRKG